MTLTPLIALTLLGLPVAQDSPRLRTLLPNGSAILVEQFPKSKVLSVQVFAGTRGCAETPATHGHRHLLEHLVLKGTNGDLDQRLEAEGIFFTGRTHRDALQFEFTGRAEQLGLLLDGVRELLSEPSWTEAELERERSIMVEEFALVPDHQRLSRTAWTAAFENAGLDPFGTLSSLSSATASGLVKLHRTVFHPRQVVVVVAGDVELRATSAQVRAILEERSSDDELEAAVPRVGDRGRREADDAYGEVRAAIVEGLGVDTAATLAAAYGAAAWIDGSYVTYTPSLTQGLVLVGRTDANNALGLAIDALGEAELAFLFPIGKLMAQAWLKDQLARPSSAASLRGLLMVQVRHLRPEDLLDSLGQVGWSSFRDSMSRFTRDRAIIAVGTRR